MIDRWKHPEDAPIDQYVKIDRAIEGETIAMFNGNIWYPVDPTDKDPIEGEVFRWCHIHESPDFDDLLNIVDTFISNVNNVDTKSPAFIWVQRISAQLNRNWRNIINK